MPRHIWQLDLRINPFKSILYLKSLKGKKTEEKNQWKPFYLCSRSKYKRENEKSSNYKYATHEIACFDGNIEFSIF